MAALVAKLPNFYEENDPERAARYQLYLQPLGDIYLGSTDLLYTGTQIKGNILYVRALGIVAVLILLIACINFINLSTARATSRAREVGVRKSLGATRQQLRRQFLGESLLYAFLSLVAAIVMLQVALPGLTKLTGKSLMPGSWLDPSILSVLAGIVLFTGLVSGAWPALLLSRYHPASALRGMRRSVKGLFPRNLLVSIQFVISTMLVVGTLVVLEQMNFMSEKNLGFTKDQIILLPTDDTAIQKQFGAFREEILSHPSILEAAGSSSVPGSSTMTIALAPEGKRDDENWIANIVRIDDFDMQSTYEFDVVAGRFFDDSYPTDQTSSIVINEALATSLGWSEPVGKTLDIEGETDGGVVIGVLKDFHFKSLRSPIEPLAIHYAPRGALLSVRFQADYAGVALTHLEKTWKKFDSVYPFVYSFLDETI